MINLERYLIPANEGIANDLWNSASKAQKGLLIGSAVLTGFGVANTIRRTFKKDRNEVTKDKWEIQKDRNKPYFENTKKVLQTMQAQCPDVLEHEMNLRKSELVKINNILKQVSQKYKKMPGIKFYTNIINEYIKDPDNEDINDGFFSCEFLRMLLPSASPAIYDYKNYNAPDWCWKSDYNIDIYRYDIYDWAKVIFGDDYRNNVISVRDYEINNQFYNDMQKIDAEIVNKCKGLKCFQTVACGGDWDDGSVYILLKPSDEFIKIAKKYGYYE